MQFPGTTIRKDHLAQDDPSTLEKIPLPLGDVINKIFGEVG
tara:strand:- start:261 stop:383 length:123 start_codon:yes stop_codon:yes gene_type:complete